MITWNAVLPAIGGAFLGAVATIAAGAFGYLNQARELDIKMVNVALTILSGQHEKETSEQARKFALRALSKYSNVEIPTPEFKEWAAKGTLPQGSFSVSPIEPAVQPGPIPGDRFKRKAPQLMRQLMKDFDLTDVQAAAIVGNLGYESGLSPIDDLGWGGWVGPRKREFRNFAQLGSLETRWEEANYRFVKHELETAEKLAIVKLKDASTISEATRIFELAYVRAGIKHYPRREMWAQVAYDAYLASSRGTPAQKEAEGGPGIDDETGYPD